MNLVITAIFGQAVTDGSLEDVIEMDAASNNGVDEIREIRDKSTYALVLPVIRFTS